MLSPFCESFDTNSLQIIFTMDNNQPNHDLIKQITDDILIQSQQVNNDISKEVRDRIEKCCRVVELEQIARLVKNIKPRPENAKGLFYINFDQSSLMQGIPKLVPFDPVPRESYCWIGLFSLAGSSSCTPLLLVPQQPLQRSLPCNDDSCLMHTEVVCAAKEKGRDLQANGFNALCSPEDECMYACSVRLGPALPPTDPRKKQPDNKFVGQRPDAIASHMLCVFLLHNVAAHGTGDIPMRWYA